MTYQRQRERPDPAEVVGLGVRCVFDDANVNLDEASREISTRGGPYYHGGIPGLKVGDELLPRRVTGNGTPSAKADPMRIECHLPPDEQREIYVTLDLSLASWWAARWPGGSVYAVAIEHPCIPPVGHEGLHFRTRRAVVRGVVWEDVFEPYPLILGEGPRCEDRLQAGDKFLPTGEGRYLHVRALKRPGPRDDIVNRKPIRRQAHAQ